MKDYNSGLIEIMQIKSDWDKNIQLCVSESSNFIHRLPQNMMFFILFWMYIPDIWRPDRL